MSRSKGEGRASGEKGQRIIDPNAYKKRKQRKKEEEEWAAKSGPVTVRRRYAKHEGGDSKND